jgi:phage-related holin
MKQYIINLTLAAIAVISPIKEALLVVGFLIAVDLILGIYAAIKNDIKIESRKLKHTVVKILVYQIVIISAFLCENYLAKAIPFINITLGYIAITEFKSIAENMGKINKQNFLKYLKTYINDRLNIKNDEQDK